MHSVDQKFIDIVTHICERPAMWVGKVSFESVCHMLDGYAMGRADMVIGQHVPDILSEQFRVFLVKKYGYEAASRERRVIQAKMEAAKASGENCEEYEMDLEGPLFPLYGTIVWWGIYKAHFKSLNLPDTELLAKLKNDFIDFANPLTRMAVEVQ